MLLLAAVRFPFLIHTRTNLVLALLFCQPESFLDTEYHAQSHFSSYHVLLLSAIFLTIFLYFITNIQLSYRCVCLSCTVAPKITLPNLRIGQSQGRQTILECTITAYPQAVSYWEKDDQTITSSSKHKIEAYDESEHTLTLSLR